MVVSSIHYEELQILIQELCQNIMLQSLRLTKFEKVHSLWMKNLYKNGVPTILKKIQTVQRLLA